MNPALSVAMALALAGPAAPADAVVPAERFAPSWADRVVLYQGFSLGGGRAEIAPADLRIDGASTPGAQGLFGAGFHPDPAKPRAALVLRSAAVRLAGSLTAMMWFRIAQPLAETDGMRLVALRGPGLVSCFIAGKGEWCALREPTFVTQVQYWPGIPNYNNPWGGRTAPTAGAWHHAAITISGGNEAAVYLDGEARDRIPVRGRPFAATDGGILELGAAPAERVDMTIDEIVVVDRTLLPWEIAEHVRATLALAHRDQPPVMEPQP